ncbi:MAG: hypothetical protein JNM52_11470 [Betaproteobacteria bacterium]|nr:hypothetical protein [Betaproteobacteria bacterium]
MQYLLERLVIERLPDGRAEPFDISAAIGMQIQRLLACRPQEPGGSSVFKGESLYSFGMPSVTELGRNNSDALKRYGRLLALQIERYEPRLKNVRIEIKPAVNGAFPHAPARLLVIAQLAETDEEQIFSFDTPGR